MLWATLVPPAVAVESTVLSTEAVTFAEHAALAGVLGGRAKPTVVRKMMDAGGLVDGVGLVDALNDAETLGLTDAEAGTVGDGVVDGESDGDTLAVAALDGEMDVLAVPLAASDVEGEVLAVIDVDGVTDDDTGTGCATLEMFWATSATDTLASAA